MLESRVDATCSGAMPSPWPACAPKLPGAVAILCSGADWPYGGDSAYFAMPFLGGTPPAPAVPNPPVYETIDYFAQAEPRDPLVSPVLDPTR